MGLSFPSPGDLPDPGIEPESCALQVDSLPSEPPGKPSIQNRDIAISDACLLGTCPITWRVREGNGNPLQYSCLENPMDGGAWQAAVHGVARSRTQLNDFAFTFHFHALEKEMATHSSVLAWRIPGTGEPGGLPSLGSYRVGHNWSNLAAAEAATESE